MAFLLNKKYMNAYQISLALLTKFVFKEHFEEEVNIGAGFQAYAMTKTTTFFTIKLYRKWLKMTVFRLFKIFNLHP